MKINCGEAEINGRKWFEELENLRLPTAYHCHLHHAQSPAYLEPSA
jgi:hypothetical protein